MEMFELPSSFHRKLNLMRTIARKNCCKHDLESLNQHRIVYRIIATACYVKEYFFKHPAECNVRILSDL